MPHLKDLRTRVAIRELQRIPGVGPSIAADLFHIGISSVEDLRGRDPAELFDRLVARNGPQDPCVLYTFRCAVYFADMEARGEPADPEKLKWWYWKGIEYPPASGIAE